MVSEDTKQFIINLRKEELELYNKSLSNENLYNKYSNIRKLKWNNAKTYNKYLKDIQNIRKNELYNETHNEFCEENETYKILRNINDKDNPHDKSMKMILSNKAEAVNVINEMLKLSDKFKIKVEDIEICENEFVTLDYKTRQSDIIYKNKEKRIYFLIENQSKIDKTMPFRIAEYSIEIMRKSMLESSKKEIPLVVPIVIYTGKAKWNVSQDIINSQVKLEGYSNLGIGNYKLLDVHNYSEKDLIEMPGVLPKILLLEKTNTITEIENIYKKIEKIKLKGSELEILNVYTLNVSKKKLGKETTEKILEKLNKESEEKSMLEDVIDEAIERGRASGIKTGKNETIKTIILNMIRRDFDDETIKTCTGINKQELERIKKEII